jgi:putative endonuclease
MKKQIYHNIDIGQKGERIASTYLRSRGYNIIERNFTTPFGEIDIIAVKNKLLTFFEVKTRTSEKYGTPLSSITRDKKKHILKNCEYYLLVKNKFENMCSIDLIAIKLDTYGDMQMLTHIKNAIIKE